VSLLRSIFRRKGRSVLTITGIGVGVFALVVLGSAAENSNVYVEKLVGYYKSIITVTEKNDANWIGMANGNRPMSMEMFEQVKAHKGVRAAYPEINMLMDAEYVSAIPPMIMSVAPGNDDYYPLSIRDGRKVDGTAEGVVMLGTDLAKQMKAAVGDSIDLRGTKFEVIGIIDRTYVNLIDAAAYISLADAQRMYFESLPEAFRESTKPEDLVVQVSVYADKGVDPDALADSIERDVTGIKATGPTQMMQMVSGIVALFNAIVGSIGLLALLVGGMSIVNTMTISVSERTREIGIKRALGASKRRIARDVLVEAATMAGIGGIAGVLLGGLVVGAMNAAMVTMTGTSALLMTPRLGLGALAFALFIGAIGGLYPAYSASRLDPAAALAYE
jgi:putative ABC transport system permease protein